MAMSSGKAGYHFGNQEGGLHAGKRTAIILTNTPNPVPAIALAI
jgi:hypothetical protein